MHLLGVGINVKNSPKVVELYKSAFGLEFDYTFKIREELECDSLKMGEDQI